MIKLFVKIALSKKQQGTRWDFMSQLLNDTLSAWLLIESLSPGEVNFTAEDILSAEKF
ncbi:Superfamily I DNA/RNA helicase protein [Staphylococcus aureus]|uniref:Superfamily I DNA/RNA helicase protein n=1 Tax=Staphylococcus aureus TaxID=1280 RepID=A0A2X2K2L5_STAAU|nr:Superfamily I DNA/RNA helicase protein [Staphylococcus aureus]